MRFPPDITTGFAFISSLLICWMITPPISKIARARRFFDLPAGRKPQFGNIPITGGVSITFSILVSTLVWQPGAFLPDLSVMLACLVLIFSIGLKDDILVTAPLTKLIAFISISLLLTIFGGLRITNFHGLFGLLEINYVTSLLISILVLLTIINGFNFIDGIDGLAGATGLMASLVFGAWFWLTGQPALSIFPATVAGALTVYLTYNLSGKRKKIFMGDSGSLVLGLSVAYMAIRFNESLPEKGPLHLYSGPAVAFGILIVPVTDIVRVFILRLVKGLPLFKPGQDHIHFLYVKLGFPHLNITLYLATINALVIALSFLLDDIGILWLVLVDTAVYLSFVFFPLLIMRKK